MKNRTTNHQSTFFLLIVIFVIGFIVRFIFSNFLKTIYVYGDELRYYGIARSFFNGTALSFRNAPTDFQKILYSLIISPSFSISNGIIRNIVIDAINCLLMCSSIFPTWLILKKMQIADNECWFTILIMLLWPDMLFSMTFMSENLYWPLSLWFIYLWIINEDSEKKSLSILGGILCYLGYMCKEIFLAMFLTTILINLLFIGKTLYAHNYRNDEHIRCSINLRLYKLIIFIVSFISCHLICKLILFSGLENSYDQMGLSAIMSPYNFIYMIYTFGYYLAAIVFSLCIIPLVYLFIYNKELCHINRKLLLFICLFLIIEAAVVAYTISVREDLGKVIPRVHLRYVGPIIILLLTMFFYLAINKRDLICLYKNRIRDFFIILAIIIPIVFFYKGEQLGSIVDQYSLLWYSCIQYIFPVLQHSGNSYIFYPYVWIVLLIFTSISGYLFIRPKKIFSILYSFLIIVALCNNVIGIVKISRAYSADLSWIDSVNKMNIFFNDSSNKNILYVTSNQGMTQGTRYIDTYFELVENLYIVDVTMLDTGNEQLPIGELNGHEPIYNQPYKKVDSIDYIIVESTVNSQQLNLINIKKLDSLCSQHYAVYENLDPTLLSFKVSNSKVFSGGEMKIYFSGENYNALNFVEYGIGSAEDGFSWTDGDKMRVEIPATLESGIVNVQISVIGTFNGEKNYSIITSEEIINGALNGAGTIEFKAQINDRKICFDINFKDAQIINEVIENSTDSRKIAFQFSTITLTEVE